MKNQPDARAEVHASIKLQFPLITVQGPFPNPRIQLEGILGRFEKPDILVRFSRP